MKNLYILTENYTQGYEISIIYLISFLAILTSIFVIITKNPVLSVLFLIGLFIIMSAYLMLLGANFLGLSYILVYVGAVSILFLFILMLINIRISELISNTSNSLILAILVVYIFFSVIINIIIYINIDYLQFNLINLILNTVSCVQLYLETLYIKITTAPYWDGNIIDIPHISGIGNIIYTNYFFWLILCSVILILAMIGAILVCVSSPY